MTSKKQNLIKVILNDSLHNRVEAYCDKYDFDKSEFVRNLIREKLFKEDLDSNPFTQKQIEDAVGVIPQLGIIPPTATEQKIGDSPIPVASYATQVSEPLPCDYCGWKDETPMVTYISTVDDVRTYGKLCARCKAKWIQTHRFIGEGDQTNA